jgi:hypothetical protein
LDLRQKKQEDGKNYIFRSFILYTSANIIRVIKLKSVSIFSPDDGDSMFL